MAAPITLQEHDTGRGYAPEVVTLCDFGHIGAAELMLLELYPSWRCTMMEWG